MLPSPSSLALTALLAIASVAPASAATPLPSWFGNANTTSQGFLLNSDDLTPDANVPGRSNSYGTPSALVDVGALGNGWENPAETTSNPGFDADGAWDVGVGADGSITFSIPVSPGAPPPGFSYRIDLQVYAIVYKDLAKIPDLSVVGLAPSDIVLQNSGVLSTEFPSGNWEFRNWTATINGSNGGPITLAITPPSGAVSVIDRVEIFTRYTMVPEPSVLLLAALPLAGLCLRRRRR